MWFTHYPPLSRDLPICVCKFRKCNFDIVSLSSKRFRIEKIYKLMFLATLTSRKREIKYAIRSLKAFVSPEINICAEIAVFIRYMRFYVNSVLLMFASVVHLYTNLTFLLLRTIFTAQLSFLLLQPTDPCSRFNGFNPGTAIPRITRQRLIPLIITIIHLFYVQNWPSVRDCSVTITATYVHLADITL